MKAIHYALLTALGLAAAIIIFVRWEQGTTVATTKLTKINAIKKSTSITTKISPKVTALGDLQSLVPTLFEHPSATPEFAVLNKLTKADETALVAYYQAQTNLLNRISTIWALAYIGDEKTFELFKHTLTQEFSGQKLTSNGVGETSDETSVMLTLVHAMSLLAYRGNESSYYFLKQGTNPWFWAEKALWTSGHGDDAYGLLTSSSIMGVGMSEHQEVPALLEELKKGELRNPVGGVHINKRNFAGAISQAAFNQMLVHKYPAQEVWQLTLSSGERKFDIWREWKTTDEGQAWGKWYSEAVKVKP